MPISIDITGQVFGRLTVLERTPRKPRAWYLCRCVCGTVKEVSQNHLTQGNVQSCGCWKIEEVTKRKTTHGDSRINSPTYFAWRNLQSRCYNPRFPDFHNYGGRNPPVTVCDHWRGKDGYIHFKEDMGECKEGESIDRIDPNGSYCKANCRWVTPRVQNRNKRNNLWHTYEGRTQILADWALEKGYSSSVLWIRIYKLGWSFEKAITTPVREKAAPS